MVKPKKGYVPTRPDTASSLLFCPLLPFIFAPGILVELFLSGVVDRGRVDRGWQQIQGVETCSCFG